jgi:hypothetical protein
VLTAELKFKLFSECVKFLIKLHLSGWAVAVDFSGEKDFPQSNLLLLRARIPE